jgi:hypothetical protein
MEEFLGAHAGPAERGSEHGIEIKQGKWKNQKISFIDIAEFHRARPASFQKKDPGQYHRDQQNDCQGCEVLWHNGSSTTGRTGRTGLAPATTGTI